MTVTPGQESESTTTTELEETTPPETTTESTTEEQPGGSPTEPEVDYKAQYLLEKEKARLAKIELENLRKTQTPPAETPKAPEKKPWDWSDPVSSIEDVVQRVVGEAVRPFRDQTQKTENERAIDLAKRDIPRFGELEDVVKSLMRQSNIDPDQVVNPQLFKTFYYTARGYLDETNAGGGETTVVETKAPPASKSSTPQHRPASAPMATQNPKKTEVKLTEAEDAVRRAQRMTVEEYVKYRDMDPAEVVKEA